MKLSAVAAAVLASMLVTGSAHAQSSGARVFVAPHVGPKWDDLYSESRRARTPVAEGGSSLGIDWGSVGVEVDLSVSQWHERQSPIQRFRYGGQTSGYLQKDHFYETASTFRRRSPEVGILFRKNRRVNERVTVTWLAGGAYAYRPENYVAVTHEVLADGRLVEVDRQEGRSTRNYLAVAAGLEAAVSLSPHLAIVPRIRVTGFPNLMDESTQAPRHLVVRPQLAVRWTF